MRLIILSDLLPLCLHQLSSSKVPFRNARKNCKKESVKTECYIARAVKSFSMHYHMLTKYSHNNAYPAQLFENIGTLGESHKTNNFNERRRARSFF